jgi:4,5-dihydroxyphthalate decarboxylase
MAHLVDLRVALGSYDHTLDLTKGDVAVAGTRPEFVQPSGPADAPRSWDVSEIPLMAYAALRAAGDESLIAIPVFISRMFPHRAIYVRADRVTTPADLRGARVGVLAWADTTAVWARGALCDMYGLSPEELDWWIGGTDEPGSGAITEAADLPAGVNVHRVERGGLLEMLCDGRIDALIAPKLETRVRALDSASNVRPLFEDPAAAERAYHEVTGCHPPLSTIAIRRGVLESQPWLASNLYRAFEVSKRRYFVRLTEISASRTAIPWTSAYVKETQRLFGDDLWPYGVDGNRSSLEVLLRYGVEQRVFASRLSVDELFAPIEPFVDGLN